MKPDATKPEASKPRPHRAPKPPAAQQPPAAAHAASAPAPIDTWLVAYDIRKPRRLRQVYRRVRRLGLALQYSGYAVQGSDHLIEHLLRQLDGVIDPGVDDLRAYRIPLNCQVWRLGRQAWPEGVVLTAGAALQALMTVAQPEGREALPAEPGSAHWAGARETGPLTQD